MIKALLFSLVLAWNLVGGFTPLTHAETTEPSTESEAVEADFDTIYQPELLPGPTQGSDGSAVQDYVLNKAFPKAYNIGIGVMGIAAFLGILIASIQMLTAYGDENKLQRAKTNMKYSILGFIFIIFAYAIVSIAVSVVLPSENDSSPAETSTHTNWWLVSIPTAHAVDVEDDINILLPSTQDFLQDDQNRIDLPSGDFLGEIVPAAVTNIMYAVGFLIFIAFIYGGTMIVYGRGNEEEVTKAKTIVTYAAIALGLLSLGYAIIYGIATLNLTQDESSTGDDLFTEDEL